MFEQGHKGGPGRPKGSTNKFSVAMLQKAFAKAAKVHDKQTILENLALKAYTDPQVALALMKFMLPVLKQIEVISENPTLWADKTPQEILEMMVKSSAPIKTNEENDNE